MRSALTFSLKPFMIAQKLARPWAFMTSYSRLNGVHASESPRLLQEILRGEWAFDGMIMVSSGFCMPS